MSDKTTFWFDNVEWRPHPWPGLMWVTAMLTVKDVATARDFYAQAFGMISILEFPLESGELAFVRMRYRGNNFTLNKEGFDSDLKAPETTGFSPPIIMYVYVDNVEDTFRRALSLGAKEMFAPRLDPWLDIRARIKCPFGYIWDLAEKQQEK